MDHVIDRSRDHNITIILYKQNKLITIFNFKKFVLFKTLFYSYLKHFFILNLFY